MGETRDREAERYPQIVRAVRETPWAILPGTLATILDIVGHRLAGERFSEKEIEARVGNRNSARPTQVAGSVAILPVYGAIVPKATLFSEMSGATSIQALREDFRSALADEEIKAIVLDIDSPGGMTDMVPEFAAELRSARGEKPIVAVANTRAASAAYWLGSQADELVVTQSGDVGSIGVFAAHDDVSAMNEKLGVKTTLVSAGKFKVEGNPLEPLGEDARAAIQDRVDEMYDSFVGDVASGRRVTVDTVRSGYGEGRMLSAQKALSEGMVDRVDTLENVVRKLQNPAGRTRVANGGNTAMASGPNFSVTATQVWSPVSGPLLPHETATSDSPWDGPGNKARLRNNGSEAYYRSAFAWQDDGADPETKAAYKFIHHEVNADGDVGAANLTACSQGIAVLNGGRTGTTIPDSDREGVWSHLAKHLRDAGREPPPLQGTTFSDAVDEAHRAFDAVVSGAEALRALTASKRDQLAALIERGKELLAKAEAAPPSADDDGLELEHAFVDADWRLRR